MSAGRSVACHVSAGHTLAAMCQLVTL